MIVYGFSLNEHAPEFQAHWEETSEGTWEDVFRLSGTEEPDKAVESASVGESKSAEDETEGGVEDETSEGNPSEPQDSEEPSPAEPVEEKGMPPSQNQPGNSIFLT